MHPQRRGETEYAISSLKLYLPEGPAVMTHHELETLREVVPINTTELDQLTTRVTNHHYGGDVNTLLQLHAATLKAPE